MQKLVGVFLMRGNHKERDAREEKFASMTEERPAAKGKEGTLIGVVKLSPTKKEKLTSSAVPRRGKKDWQVKPKEELGGKAISKPFQKTQSRESLKRSRSVTGGKKGARR